MQLRLVGAFSLFIAATGYASQPPPGTAAPGNDAVDDATARAIVADELKRAVADQAPSAAVILVLDPRDGRVVASAGWRGGPSPGFDPALPRTRAWVTGSTLKPLTVAAALDAGVVSPETRFDCATRTYPEGLLNDYAPHGTLSVRDIVAVSSNVGASRVLDALGRARLEEAFQRLHVFAAPGAIPPIASGFGLAAALLASGELAPAAPLNVAAAFGALFDHGRYHVPTDDGHGPSEVAISAEAADATVALLENAVSGPLGTGRKAIIAGHRVAGKTGTAELADGGVYASFVGAILDLTSTRVVLIGLENPKAGTGAAAAAPVFARLAARLVAH